MSQYSASASAAIDSQYGRRSWRRITDKIQTYDVAPGFNPGALLEDIPLEIARYPNAFVSRRQIINSKDGVRFESPKQWYSRGAIYDSHGMLLPEYYARTNTLKYDDPPEMPGERIAAATRVEGKAVYLGTLSGHFGHFLVESLARAWGVLQQDKNVRVIFHLANATKGGPFHDPAQLGLAKFIAIILDALGIGAGRLILANRDILVEELLVPTAQFVIAETGSKGLTLVYDHIRAELHRKYRSAVEYPKKVYLTRITLAASNPQKLVKSIANEDRLEALFAAHGFEIVCPERLPFEEQVALISNATHIAGTTGSALHAILFNNNPDAQVISVEWRNSKTQYILEAARGLKAAHICCFDGRNEANRPLVDIDVVDQALTDLMGASELPRLQAPIPQVLSGRYIPDKQSISGKQDSVADKPVAISLEGGVPLIRAFDAAKPEGVSANYHSMTIWALLASVQAALGIKGDVLGAGVDLATGLFELVMLQSEEKGLFVEIDTGDATHVQADSLPEDLRSQARFLKIQNDEGDIDRLLDRRFRWLHVTGSLAYDDVRRDLERLSRFVADDGILVVDHFFDQEAPAATLAVYEFLSEQKDWKVLLVCFNEVYLVRASAKTRYEDVIRRNVKAFLAEFGTFRFSPRIPMAGDFVFSIKGSPHKVIRLAKSA